MLKQLIILVLPSFLFLGCNHTGASEFENTSGIAIPEGAVEKESYDDKKLVKINSFKVDSAALHSLVLKEQFNHFTGNNRPQFWGMVYLKEKPVMTDLQTFYYKSGTSGTNSWIYIADLKSAMLWTEIKYQGKPSY